MKITDIKAQVKTAGRYSIFVEGKYSFSLSDTALLEQDIKIGKELDEAEVKRLKQVSSDDKLYGNALRYMMMRPRSEWELRSYLQRKNSPAPLTQQILNKLSLHGLINDLAFAEAWVRSRRLLRSASKRKLQQELRAKRVSDEVVKQALFEDATDESAVLRELVAKKRQQARYKDDLKLMQYLVRQGFSYDDVKSAVTSKDDE
jgi:regulatory protein